MDNAGYVIYKNVLSAIDINNYILDIKNNNLERSSNGIVNNNGSGHSPPMIKIRNNKNVINAFAKIWNTSSDNLITSYDTYGVMLKGDIPSKLWPHRDESVTARKRTYQGLVQLTENKEEGLVIWPGTHKPPYILPSEVDLNKYKLVLAPAGSLIIWDSRLVHCNLNKGLRDRLVLYVCMVPKSMVSQKALNRLSSYKQRGLTTNHNPFFPVAHPT
jgi:ectoine hydroxylase-related dioxygenase (phytanoyl-CoA dioxygenase family)